jgi:TPR repeat protein
MDYLGFMFEYGKGVPQDYAEALKWLHKAAEQGDTSAMDSLASMYRYGEGVTQDYAEAVKWYRKAAELGYAGAMVGQGCSTLSIEFQG